MTKVALILDPEFGSQITGIAADMPVWILSSSRNAAEIQRARQMFPSQQITELLPRAAESRVDLLARGLIDVDEHLGPNSSSDPYQAVFVYGAVAADLSNELAAECGFKVIEPNLNGFVARK